MLLRFNKVYLEEPNKNAEGLIQNKVIYFENSDSDGKELELEQFYKTSVASEQIIDVPIFEEQDVKINVPFISFDENGDEVTKHREVVKRQKVQIGHKKRN